jgi:hypothetical protein
MNATRANIKYLTGDEATQNFGLAWKYMVWWSERLVVYHFPGHVYVGTNIEVESYTHLL